KPLYYSQWENGIAFASEIKTLLQLPQIQRSINPQRLYDFLTCGMTDTGAETILSHISQLPAAHSLTLSLTSPQQNLERYWQVTPDQTLDLSFAQAARQCRDLFLENISLHLRSDVPVGVALSGGVDSSSIVMAMRHLNPQQEIHSFSYTAEDPSINEESWIDIAFNAAQTHAHKTQPTPQDLSHDLDHLIE
ncbi:MAG: asparagine synthase-related protein, partial [Microcystaceae cyanobacterium]